MTIRVDFDELDTSDDGWGRCCWILAVCPHQRSHHVQIGDSSKRREKALGRLGRHEPA